MINTNRIVPVTKEDLISLYGLILLQASGNSGLVALAADDVDGDFTVKTNNGVLLANQPAKTIDIDKTASSVSACTVYFVPAFDYAGFTVDGAAATVADNDVVVNPDGHTLYKAVYGSNTVTITKAGF